MSLKTARQQIKKAIKKKGAKLSHFTNKEITRAAQYLRYLREIERLTKIIKKYR